MYKIFLTNQLFYKNIYFILVVSIIILLLHPNIKTTPVMNTPTYKLKIKVTKQILEQSKTCGGNMGSCAIAQAVRDIFPTAIVGFSEMALFSPPVEKDKPEVFNNFWQGIKYNRPKDNYVKVPEEMYQFISLFDRTTEEERPNLPECEFEIELTDEIIARINIDELTPLLVNHPNLSLELQTV